MGMFAVQWVTGGAIINNRGRLVFSVVFWVMAGLMALVFDPVTGLVVGLGGLTGVFAMDWISRWQAWRWKPSREADVSARDTYKAARTEDLRHWLTLGLPLALPIGLLLGLTYGPRDMLVVRLLAGLVGGLLFWLVGGLLLMLYDHEGRTLWLWLSEFDVWNRTSGRVRFMPLLERALERQVLRQAGAVYQFRHAELQDRLAAWYEREHLSGATPDTGCR
jgi:hypothetical protein